MTDVQVARMAELPDELRIGCEAGFAAWRSGQFAEARDVLTSTLEAARSAECRDAVFHAAHLLGCVAFSEGDYAASRRWHEDVLEQCRALDFNGGMGSSLYDIAMIDEVEGDLESARARYAEALERYEQGGYAERVPIVQLALDRVSTRS